MKSVLVIDDSVDIQCLLTLLLESKGYSIACESNGEDGLNFLNSAIELPDIILVDLRMPIMDGWGFLEELRATRRLKDIHTVVMTGEEHVEILAKDGKAPLLRKPLSVSSVLEAIEKRQPVH